MVLYFEVVSVPEYTLVPGSDTFRLFIIPILKCISDLATHAGTEGNNTFVVFLEELMIHTRKVIKAIQIRSRAELHQILIPLIVHSQQNEVVTAFVLLRVFIGVATGGDIGFDTDDRLYFSCFSFFIKFD